MTEYAGKKQIEFPREDPVIKHNTEKKKKKKERREEASIDLCYRNDWRPTGSALDLVRDRILHWTSVEFQS